MKKIKLIILVSFLFGIVTVSMAQTKTYQYTYDNAGNRLTRNVVYVAFKMANRGGNFVDSEAPQSLEAIYPDTASSQLGTLNINIYPNPTVKGVNVEFSQDDMSIDEVRILDGNGKMIYQRKSLTGNLELPFEAFAAGRYFIWLKINGTIERFPVIKE